MVDLSNTSEIFSHVAHERRSVRAFTKERVSDEVLERVFSDGQRAPSNCNTQPWQLVVLSGDACDRMRKKVFEAFTQGEFSMDFPYDGKYEGVYKERQYDAAEQLYSAQGITREDKAARNDAFLRNFTFFDAPHVAFFFLPEPFGLREAADLGMYAQTIMLALVANGLASCPQTALSMSCKTIHEELGTPASHKLIFGLSFGFEDKDHPANKCRVGRASLTDTVKFVA